MKEEGSMEDLGWAPCGRTGERKEGLVEGAPDCSAARRMASALAKAARWSSNVLGRKGPALVVTLCSGISWEQPAGNLA